MTGPIGPDELLVGIDIGGTKTHLRAVAGSGAVRERVVASAEWRRRDWQDDAAALLAMAADLAGGQTVRAIGVGAHGCDDDEECRAFQAAFAAQTAVPLSVVNDSELMPLALGLGSQIGVVAGTGSIAVCRTPGGTMLVAGGWGWIIGDEGSAASLVRDAARAVAEHFDAGGGFGEPLVDALFAALEVPAVPRLGTVLAALGTPAAVGRHAPVVFAAADAGSVLAGAVVARGGRALAELAIHLDRRGAGADHVVAGGSVIVSQPRLWDAFVAGLDAAAPGRFTPHLFTGVPVVGACNLAATLAASRAGALSPAAS